MKYYAQYFNGKREACGSDSILPLDGRLSIGNLASRARQHAERLRSVGRRFTSFEVRKGDLKSYSVVWKGKL